MRGVIRARAKWLSYAQGDAQRLAALLPLRLRRAGQTLLPRLTGVHGVGSSFFAVTVAEDVTIRRADGAPIYALNYHAINYIRFEAAEQVLVTPDEAQVLACLGTLNHDGYVRERYVRRMMEHPVSDLWPFIIVRLADWVPNISQLVDGFLLDHPLAINSAFIRANLELLEHVEARVPKAKSLGVLLVRGFEESTEAFAALPERRRKQIAFGWLSQPDLDLKHLETILSDPSPGVRMAVVQRWRSDFGEDLAVRIAHDRSWLLRKVFYHRQFTGPVPRYKHLDSLVLRR